MDAEGLYPDGVRSLVAVQGNEGTARAMGQRSGASTQADSEVVASGQSRELTPPSGKRGKKRLLPEGGARVSAANVEEGMAKGKAAAFKKAKATAAAAARAQDQGSDESGDSGSEGDMARKHRKGRKKAKPRGKGAPTDIAKVAMGAGARGAARIATASPLYTGAHPSPADLELARVSPMEDGLPVRRADTVMTVVWGA